MNDIIIQQQAIEMPDAATIRMPPPALYHDYGDGWLQRNPIRPEHIARRAIRCMLCHGYNGDPWRFDVCERCNGHLVDIALSNLTEEQTAELEDNMAVATAKDHGWLPIGWKQPDQEPQRQEVDTLKARMDENERVEILQENTPAATDPHFDDEAAVALDRQRLNEQLLPRVMRLISEHEDGLQLERGEAQFARDLRRNFPDLPDCTQQHLINTARVQTVSLAEQGRNMPRIERAQRVIKMVLGP